MISEEDNESTDWAKWNMYVCTRGESKSSTIAGAAPVEHRTDNTSQCGFIIR